MANLLLVENSTSTTPYPLGTMENSSGTIEQDTDSKTQIWHEYETSHALDTVIKFMGYWEMVSALIGIPVNILVICLACAFSRRRDNYFSHHLCILSMAIADCMFLVTHSPLQFAYYGLNADIRGASCKILYFFTHLTTVASSLSLLCLNVDKFICIHSPLRYEILVSGQKAKVCIAFIWLISVAWAAHFISGPMTKFEDICHVTTTAAFVYPVFATVFFVMPTTASLCVSIYILHVACKARMSPDYRNLYESNGSSRRRGSSSGQQDTLLKPPGPIMRQRSNSSPGGCRPSSSSSQSAHSNSTQNLSCAAPAGPATMSKSSRLKTVTFIFSTTVWSSVTYLPFRIAYLLLNPMIHWQMCLGYVLFSVMVTNATGNAFITVLTQYQYRRKAKKLIKHLITFWKKNGKGQSENNNVIVEANLNQKNGFKADKSIGIPV